MRFVGCIHRNFHGISANLRQVSVFGINIQHEHFGIFGATLSHLPQEVEEPVRLVILTEGELLGRADSPRRSSTLLHGLAELAPSCRLSGSSTLRGRLPAGTREGFSIDSM